MEHGRSCSEDEGSQGFTLKSSGHYRGVTIQNVKEKKLILRDCLRDRLESHRELSGVGAVKFPQLIRRYFKAFLSLISGLLSVT